MEGHHGEGEFKMREWDNNGTQLRDIIQDDIMENWAKVGELQMILYSN